MLTSIDKVIIQSHIRRIRLKTGIKKDYPMLTNEYIFACLLIEEIGLYQSRKNTVVQTTIPTLSNRLEDFVIPILDDSIMKKITTIVKKAMELKDSKKKLILSMKEKVETL